MCKIYNHLKESIIVSLSCVKWYNMYVTVLLLICIAGCGQDRPVVVLENISWPDGSVVSIIQEGRIVDRSTLYGDYVRLRAAGQGLCRIRAGERNALTWLSGKVLLKEGENHITLPAPSIRRRTGNRMFGYADRTPVEDAARDLLFENPVPGVTTLTVQADTFHSNEILRERAVLAHTHATEFVVSLSLNTLPDNRKSEHMFRAGLDSMETAGVDGILLAPVPAVYSMGIFPRFVRFAAREIHHRGMTLSVVVPESWPEHISPGVLFRDIPAPEVPDMIRIAAPRPSEENPSPDIVGSIERITDRLVRDGVPRSRISAELALSAAAFTPRQGGGYSHAQLEHGELADILPAAGMDAVLRLRDGTLRLGFRGKVYSFEDVEGLTWKLRRLRESVLAPKGGIHILHDGMGVTLDRDGLKRLSEAYIVR
jgi:hypothetical protein